MPQIKSGFFLRRQMTVLRMKEDRSGFEEVAVSNSLQVAPNEVNTLYIRLINENRHTAHWGIEVVKNGHGICNAPVRAHSAVLPADNRPPELDQMRYISDFTLTPVPGGRKLIANIEVEPRAVLLLEFADGLTWGNTPGNPCVNLVPEHPAPVDTIPTAIPAP